MPIIVYNLAVIVHLDSHRLVNALRKDKFLGQSFVLFHSF